MVVSPLHPAWRDPTTEGSRRDGDRTPQPVTLSPSSPKRSAAQPAEIATMLLTLTPKPGSEPQLVASPKENTEPSDPTIE